MGIAGSLFLARGCLHVLLVFGVGIFAFSSALFYFLIWTGYGNKKIVGPHAIGTRSPRIGPLTSMKKWKDNFWLDFRRDSDVIWLFFPRHGQSPKLKEGYEPKSW